MNNHEKTFYWDQIREKLDGLLPWQLSQFHDAIAVTSKAVANRTKCRGCGASIIWSKTEAGKACPFNYATGENHFKTCPEAKNCEAISP